MADAMNRGKPERAGFSTFDHWLNKPGWLTRKNLSPVSRDPGTAIPGSRLTGLVGCHVIAKLIFMAFNKLAQIPAN